MNGKKLLKEKLGLLLTLLVVVAVGAAVSFGIKRKNAEEDGTDAAASASTADTASGRPEKRLMKIRIPPWKKIRRRQFT